MFGARKKMNVGTTDPRMLGQLIEKAPSGPTEEISRLYDEHQEQANILRQADQGIEALSCGVTRVTLSAQLDIVPPPLSPEAFLDHVLSHHMDADAEVEPLKEAIAQMDPRDRTVPVEVCIPNVPVPTKFALTFLKELRSMVPHPDNRGLATKLRELANQLDPAGQD